MWTYNYTGAPDELMHYGRKGMKWYQHIFGDKRTRTVGSSRKHGHNDDSDEHVRVATYASSSSSSNPSKSKPISEMSNAEIQQKIDRIRLENTLRSLQPQKVSAGKKYASALLDTVIGPAVIDAGQKYLKRILNKALGNDKTTDVKSLRTQEEIMRLKYKIHTYRKQMSK